jgi:D-glycero-D-manno-heptose 1,7-bisphosphate phosphatase
VKLVLLDRDGVVNEDRDDYVKSPEEWRPIPGSLEAIARLCEAGFEVVVVSNQSGLARGLFDRATLDAIHDEMRRAVESAGGRLAGVFVCPHAPDAGCGCRKPAVGLLRQVESALGVAVAGAPLVGDKAADLELARNAGCLPVLVRTGKGRRTERTAALDGVAVFDDLRAFAGHWAGRSPSGGRGGE